MCPMEGAAAGAAQLKALRHRRGLSLAGVARALIVLAGELHQPPLPSVASVQRSVARWESPKSPTLPDQRYQLLLAHLYARTPAGDLSLGAGSDFAEYLHALGLLGESERRTAELRGLVLRAVTDAGGGLLGLLSPTVQAGLTAALEDPRRTGEEAIAGLASVVADVNAEVGSLPMVRLQLLLAPAVETCRRLLAGPVPDPLVPKLREVAVAAATPAGRLAFETRDDSAFGALYEEATRTAERLAQPWRKANVHMSHALVTLYSTQGIDQAWRLVDHAVRAARSGESTLVRARAHALQAEIAARAGHGRQARAALGLAWYDIEADHAEDPAPFSFSPGHLRGFEGVCELYATPPRRTTGSPGLRRCCRHRGSRCSGPSSPLIRRSPGSGSGSRARRPICCTSACPQRRRPAAGCRRCGCGRPGRSCGRGGGRTGWPTSTTTSWTSWAPDGLGQRRSP